MGNFTFKKDLSGAEATPAWQYVPIADSQTLVVGDVVVLSSGKAAKAGNGTGRVLGVMAEDITTGSSAGGPLAKIWVTNPNQIWRGTASADASSHVLAARTYDLTSAQLVNVSDTTGGCLQIVSLVDGVTTSVDVVFTANELG